MIEPCPECGKKPEPIKASYEAWTIACCGLSATDPWFVSVILIWRDVVDIHKKAMEREGKHELKL